MGDEFHDAALHRINKAISGSVANSTSRFLGESLEAGTPLEHLKEKIDDPRGP